MPSQDVVRLCGHYRLARMLEREDFRSRLAQNQPISVHELLYPLLTAYDAVALQSDVEIGATEQKFNLLVHRDIQREYGQPSEVALTMPILVGLDGTRKMSKSLNNYIAITEAPGEMFGKIMSISDEVMWTYYELLTDFVWPVIVRLREEVKTGVLHPMDAKMQLAHTIVAGFHGEEAGKKARGEFQRVFRERESPNEVQEIKFTRASGGLVGGTAGSNFEPGTVLSLTGAKKWSQLLAYLDAVESVSEAERIIKQGGLEIDGQIVKDPAAKLNPDHAATYALRLGKKKFFRIVVE
jgi:tyrosyl-tRNA synthetase